MLYLDNAATANPKAPGVGEAMARSLADCNANPGHGGHRLAVQTTLAVYTARDSVARLLGVADPSRLVFTAGATAALNQAIRGSLPAQGGHVICSTWEHNAVLRPLWDWRRHSGGTVTVLPGRDGYPVHPYDLERAIRPDTALIVLNAASNVTGALSPVVEAGEIARRHGVRFLVDGSQVAGHLSLDLDALPLDLWACPGHKGLLGPQGIGVLYIRSGLELEPLLLGGAGFDSSREDPPEEAPERYEAGTVNTPGILGLGAAAEYLLTQEPAEARAREIALLAALGEGLARVRGVQVFTAPDPRRGVGVVSCRIAGWSSGTAADVLDQEYGICVRAGLHCAPLAHQALGTRPDGTVRVSLGPFNTEQDVDAVVQAIAQLAARAGATGAVPVA